MLTSVTWLALLFTYSTGRLIEPNFDGTNLIKDCLHKIVNNTFNERPIIFMSDDEMKDYIPKTDLIQLHYDFKEVQEWNESYYYTNHVVLGKNQKSVMKMYDLYRNTTLFNAKFTVKGRVIIYTKANNEKSYEEIIRHFWNTYLLHVVILNETEFYYIYPYWNSTCGGTIIYKHLGDCRNKFNSIEWEPFPRNLTNCTMNAASYGLHIKMPYLDDTNLNKTQTGVLNQPLRILKERYDLNINYIVPDLYDQDTYPSIGSTFFYKHLYESKIYDLVMVEPFRLPHTPYYYESSDIIFFERKAWISPKPKQLSKINVLFNLFDLNLWIACFGVLLLVILLTWLINKIPLIEAFLIIYSLEIGVSVPTLPTTFNGRLLMLFFFVYSFHIIYFFQGQLSGVLTSPSYELPINSFERLAKSKLTILFYYKVNYDTFRNSLNAFVHSMRNRTVLYITEDYNPAEFVFKHDNYSVSAFLHNSNITEAHKKELVFFADSVLYSFEPTYVARKGYPFLQTINHVLINIKESGLTYKWLTDLQKIAFIPDSDANAIVISFDHLQAPFILWSSGLLLSVVIFFTEVFFSYKKARPYYKCKG